MPTKIPHVKIHLLREQTGREKRLGRHIVHDPRSREFPAAKAQKIKSVDHAGQMLPLDQGEIGSCTANAALAAMLSEPYYPKLHAKIEGNEKFALSLYREETQLHPHDGVYPPQDPGGCGLWIAKVLKNRGLIKSYEHAFGIEHALKALVLRPVIFGFDWYSSFDNVNVESGLVEIDEHARIEGGHEIAAYRIDAENELVWFWQSWGTWGFENSGRFCMSFGTVDRLLKNGGDCTQFTL